MACTPSELLNDAACLTCLDDHQLRAIIASLLCQVSESQAAQPLVYRAIMAQSGTAAPTATVLENTIGPIVWTRAAPGLYVGTLTGAFPIAKTMVMMTTANASEADYFEIIESTRLDANRVQIITTAVDVALGAAGQIDDCLEPGKGIGIEILVYP